MGTGKRIHLVLKESESKELEVMAKAFGITRSKLIRLAIDSWKDGNAQSFYNVVKLGYIGVLSRKGEIQTMNREDYKRMKELEEGSVKM